MMKHVLKRAFILVVLVVLSTNGVSFAVTSDQKDLLNSGIYYYDKGAISCTTSASDTTDTSTATSASPGANKDYTGKTILNKGQLEKIAENKPFYEQAAKEADIPWQLLAVTHLREHGLAKDNPDNGQGAYQFVSKQGGPYPTGPISDAEFLRQTKLAANFLKSKAKSNVAGNKDLTATSDADTIKDTLFSYNGRAEVYAKQAASLGYDKNKQPFEGSPYVMNKADAKRDPNANPTGWGQVKRDFGGIEYPANQGYGAFVIYAAMAGIPIGSSCNGISGPTREKVVALAQAELALWDAGKLVPGSGKNKYTQGREEDWCADFVSWLYNQAGYPLSSSKEGNVPAVATIRTIGEKNDKFKWHDSSSYTPKPGDLAIQDHHVMIVVGLEGSKVNIIGGNQGGNGNGFNASRVSANQFTSPSDGNILGYVSPD